eukprot:11579859-Prorocentrum_lima.AAC.1
MLKYTPASRNSVVLNFTFVLKYTIVPADTLLLDYILAVQGREGHRVAATFFCPCLLYTSPSPRDSTSS